MRPISRILILVLALQSCSGSDKPSENSSPGKHESIKKVSYYSDDNTIAVSYFSPDTNWTELARELLNERDKIFAEKDTAITYHLIVFNDLKFTPDITTDYNIMWADDYNNFRTCGLDNHLGFPRFCYGVRFDMGRIGDWSEILYVQPDGSLVNPDSVYQ